jgi:hypothetical protein
MEMLTENQVQQVTFPKKEYLPEATKHLGVDEVIENHVP